MKVQNKSYSDIKEKRYSDVKKDDEIKTRGSETEIEESIRKKLR